MSSGSVLMLHAGRTIRNVFTCTTRLCIWINYAPAQKSSSHSSCPSTEDHRGQTSLPLCWSTAPRMCLRCGSVVPIWADIRDQVQPQQQVMTENEITNQLRNPLCAVRIVRAVLASVARIEWWTCGLIISPPSYSACLVLMSFQPSATFQ